MPVFLGKSKKPKVEGPVEAELVSEPPEEIGEQGNQRAPSLQIPSELWKGAEEDLLLWLENELYLAEMERSQKISNFARWKVVYKAPLPDEPKNFPIHNASNLTVPVVKEIVNTLASQLAQMTLVARPRWFFEDLAPEWEPFLDEISRFMDVASDRDLNFEEEMIPVLIEAVKMGTSVLEVGHEVDVRKLYEYSEDGTKVFPRERVYHDGPTCFRVPIADFWIRIGENDLQKARWCGKKISYSEMELREKEAAGKFVNIDKILQFYQNDESNEAEEIDNEIRDEVPRYFGPYEIFELYVRYDIDSDGRFEEIRLYFHRDSRTFIGKEFLPYRHGKRPFVKFGYFPVEDSFYDEGLCEMLEGIQLGISTKHNQRSDNATMANLKMIIKRKLLKSLQPGDPLYTGKIIEANDIWNDIREFQMAEIYPSTISEEQILRNYAERLSGSNEAVAGAGTPVTRTTAAAQLALLQEQRNRMGLTVSMYRKGIGRVGWFSLELYSQFGTNGKAIAWMGEKGKIVEAVFGLPRRVSEMGRGIRAKAPTSLENQTVKRENAIAMFNLLTQLYERLLPLAAQLAPDAVPEVAKALVSSAQKFMGDVLESFDSSDPEGVLEGLRVLERVLPSPENLGGLESFERRTETTKVLEGVTRLEDLLRQAEASRDGNVRVSNGDQRTRRAPPPERNGRGGGTSIILGGTPSGS